MSAELLELRAVARKMLAGTAEWPLMADAGWLGLEVPEALGGSGVTFAEVAVILQEQGRAAAASPYLGTVALGVAALTLLDAPGVPEVLGGIAAGVLRAAVAVPAG